MISRVAAAMLTITRFFSPLAMSSKYFSTVFCDVHLALEPGHTR
jgi:hypothetical protein